MDFMPRDRYTVSDLVSMMALLRSEGGCPWDRAQTHASIRSNVIEEAYEVADAIDRNDPAALCEELGDLLLQVVFHSRMGEEDGSFSMDDVADGICRKLILRHPHIFGGVKAENNPEAVLKLWEEIKVREKGQVTATDTLRAVPANFPALMRSQKLQSRAARTGFQPSGIAEAFDVLRAETAALADSAARQDAAACVEKMGDVLFSATQVSRMLGIDAEESLSVSCRTFIDRFAKVERLADERQIDMQTASAERLLALWREAKQ